ncbi:MAG: hypothetical protein RR466_08600, partial [Hungatella sp.]
MDIYWRRIKYIGVAVILLLSLLGAGWYVKTHNYHLLQSAKVLAENENFVLGLDIDKDNYYLFRLSKDGKQQDIITYPMQKDGYFVSLDDCVIDINGEVYLRVTMSNESDTKMPIGICDFESGEIQLQQDLIDLFDQDGRGYWGNIITSENQFYVLMVDVKTDRMSFSAYKLKEDGRYEMETVLPDFLGAHTLIPGKDLTMLCLDQEGNFYKTDEN